MYTIGAILLAALSLASAKTIDVNVGQNGLSFTPSIVTANPGDKVDFHFFPQNHTVTQSSFQAPCVPIKPDGGIFSGFQSTKAESPSVFEVTVNDTTPIWIYCSQAKHCQSGMSMVINQPNNNKTLAAYQQAAKSVPASGAPPHVNGGIFITETSTSSNSSPTGTYSSSTASGTGSYSSGSGSSSSGSGSSSSGSGSSSSGSGTSSSGTNTASGPSSTPNGFTGSASVVGADSGIVAAVVAVMAAALF